MIANLKDKKRARAHGVLALLLGALALGGCATSSKPSPAPAPIIAPPLASTAIDDTADFSVFLARSSFEARPPAKPCRTKETCPRGVYDQVLEPFEWIAGNSQIKRLTQDVLLLGNPTGATLLLVRAERDEEGQWAVVEAAPIRITGCMDWKAGEKVDALGLEGTLWSQELSPGGRRQCLGRRLLAAPR